VNRDSAHRLRGEQRRDSRVGNPTKGLAWTLKFDYDEKIEYQGALGQHLFHQQSEDLLPTDATASGRTILVVVPSARPDAAKVRPQS